LGRRRAVPTLVTVCLAAFFLLWRGGGPDNIHSPRRADRAPPSKGYVAFVPDGDTIKLSGGQKVRYLGIDSPERGEAYYEEARAKNRRLVNGKRVELHRDGPEERDRYGRTLALVYVNDGTSSESICVNLELVREGLASVYIAHEDAISTRTLEDLIAAQRTAMAQRIGIWPARLSRARRDPPLVSTRFRIHRERCGRLGPSRARRVRNLEEAFGKGKSLCRSCKPLAAR